MCPQSKSDSLRSQGLIRLLIYSIDNYCKRDCVSGTIEIQWSTRQIRFLAQWDIRCAVLLLGAYHLCSDFFPYN